jgi:hypothetical protein
MLCRSRPNAISQSHRLGAALARSALGDSCRESGNAAHGNEATRGDDSEASGADADGFLIPLGVMVRVPPSNKRKFPCKLNTDSRRKALTLLGLTH